MCVCFYLYHLVSSAAFVAGRQDLLLYFLPLHTMAMLFCRVREENERSRRRYGRAWEEYCSQVTADIIPKVY